MYDEDALELYREFVVERHRIWQRRQDGVKGPWTKDPVLANRKFTNMFRVVDPGSQFLFNLKTDNPRDQIARLVFYRITNLPETWRVLRRAFGRWPVAEDFDPRWNHGIVRPLTAYRDAGNQVFSGAYIIIPEPGTPNDKVEGAVRLVQRFLEEQGDAFLAAKTQKERFDALRSISGLGPFLSMQILTDWGYLQDEEPDLSFVVAGPGARRGAAFLNPDVEAEDVIRDLAEEWHLHPIVRMGRRSLTPMDVQNTLCEVGKYVRELENPRKKSPYAPSHPGEQPRVILPTWW